MNKIKILHVIHGLPRGGLENGVVNLLNGLPENRYEQFVCCLDQKGQMADRIIRPVDIYLMNRKRYDFSVPFRLAKIIKQIRPNIIHCRNWNTWLDTAMANLLAGRQAKLVWSFHGFADGY